jgi:hypothetical protein
MGCPLGYIVNACRGIDQVDQLRFWPADILWALFRQFLVSLLSGLACFLG